MNSILKIFSIFIILICLFAPAKVLAQIDDTNAIDRTIEEGLLGEPGREPTAADQQDQEEEELPEDIPEPSPPPIPTGGGIGPSPPVLTADVTGATTQRQVKISGIVVMNYVYDNSPDSFVVKYRWELKGEVNADNAVIKGDVELAADVDGFLSKWATGECKLDISIPKVPFELAFKKTSEEKGDLRLILKKPITEEWTSKCTFKDSPGAKFDTSGPPERWLARAIEKARPPLRSIVIDLKDEETTTPMVISKETIADPPIGSMEIEGQASVTITPGGE